MTTSEMAKLVSVPEATLQNLAVKFAENNSAWTEFCQRVNRIHATGRGVNDHGEVMPVDVPAKHLPITPTKADVAYYPKGSLPEDLS